MENLQSAIAQLGPWKGESLSIDKYCVKEKLSEKAASIDWEVAKRDVQPFLHDRQLRSVDLWNKKFFLELIHQT